MGAVGGYDDQQRRWQEEQRQEQQRQEQQRREQERRDQERRQREYDARRRHAAEIEADRIRHAQKLREQQAHALQMQALHQQEKTARQEEITRRENAGKQFWQRMGSTGSTSFDWSNTSRSRPRPRPTPDDSSHLGSGNFVSESKESKLFARIDDFIVALITKGAVPIAIIGAASGFVFGWRAHHPLWNKLGSESLTADGVIGVIGAFLAVGLLRYVARILLYALALAVVIGFGWLFFRVVSVFFDLH